MNVYTEEDCSKLLQGENLEGKIVVLNCDRLSPQYRDKKYQLWRAESGFGCDPTKLGRAVFATCLSDGERARWDRGDFIGIFKEQDAEKITK